MTPMGIHRSFCEEQQIFLGEQMLVFWPNVWPNDQSKGFAPPLGAHGDTVKLSQNVLLSVL